MCRSGTVSREEVRTVCRAIGVPVQERELEELITRSGNNSPRAQCNLMREKQNCVLWLAISVSVNEVSLGQWLCAPNNGSADVTRMEMARLTTMSLPSTSPVNNPPPPTLTSPPPHVTTSDTPQNKGTMRCFGDHRYYR